MSEYIKPVWANVAAPCGGVNGCPAQTNIAGALHALALGDVSQAWRIMMRTHPFRSVLGRVCYGFCEAPCNRGRFDSPIAIQALEAAIGDLGHDPAWTPPRAAANGRRVMVAGAGPCGLTAAWYLGLAGFEVEVFEAEEKPGGMMRYGIPSYRLEKEALDREIKYLENSGVRINLKFPLNNSDIMGWLNQGKYHAALVATGAGTSRAAGFAGEEKAINGLEFLKKVNTGAISGPFYAGKSLVVIGGGNVAMDASRSLIRLGAKSVTVIYRRSEKEMPAHSHEVAQAREEGVAFEFMGAPEQYDGRKLTIRRMKPGKPDASGRMAPEPTSTLVVFPADGLITAVGQVWTQWDFPPDHERIYFAGDARPDSRGTVIHAIASGKAAADLISRDLAGKALFAPVGEEASWEKMNVRRYFTPSMRLRILRQRPEARIKSFDPFERIADHEEAQLEAGRCFRCGTCVGGLDTECDYCFLACGQRGMVAKKLVDWNPEGPFYDSGEGCSSCGKCWEDCPRYVVRPARVTP
ncbi:MAG: FAD-dependent oxidoreductase [Nitrospinota bacterium]|nr:FAD-dependent oxidoreductase [Nitrospinota bacterium]